MLGLHDALVDTSLVYLPCKVIYDICIFPTRWLTMDADAMLALLLYDAMIQNEEETKMIRVSNSTTFKAAYIVYRLGSIGLAIAEVVGTYSIQ